MPFAARHRIPALDLLRGYFLYVIIIDHLFRFPGIFEIFSGRGQLWVSAAEGFFIISGLLVGYIYGAPGVSGLVSRLWSRAAKLYFLSLVLTLLFTIWGQALPADLIKSGIWSGSLNFDFLLQTLSFRYIYGWADFLPYYAVYLFLSPLAIYLLRHRQIHALAAFTLVVWAWGRQSSMFFSWQFLFFSGVIAGYFLPQIEFHFSRLAFALRRSLARIFTLAAGLTLFLSVWVISRADFVYHPSFWFDKNTVGPGRFVLAWLWFIVAYYWLRRYSDRFDSLTHGFFNVLGRQSLLVYVTQSFVLFPITWLFSGYTSFFSNVLVNAGVLSIVYSVAAASRLLPKISLRLSAHHLPRTEFFRLSVLAVSLNQ